MIVINLNLNLTLSQKSLYFWNEKKGFLRSFRFISELNLNLKIFPFVNSQEGKIHLRETGELDLVEKEVKLYFMTLEDDRIET